MPDVWLHGQQQKGDDRNVPIPNIALDVLQLRVHRQRGARRAWVANRHTAGRSCILEAKKHNGGRRAALTTFSRCEARA